MVRSRGFVQVALSLKLVLVTRCSVRSQTSEPPTSVYSPSSSVRLRVSGLGFGVQGLGVGVKDSGCFWVWGFAFFDPEPVMPTGTTTLITIILIVL